MRCTSELPALWWLFFIFYLVWCLFLSSCKLLLAAPEVVHSFCWVTFATHLSHAPALRSNIWNNFQVADELVAEYADARDASNALGANDQVCMFSIYQTIWKCYSCKLGSSGENKVYLSLCFSKDMMRKTFVEECMMRWMF